MGTRRPLKMQWTSRTSEAELQQANAESFSFRCLLLVASTGLVLETPYVFSWENRRHVRKSRDSAIRTDSPLTPGRKSGYRFPILQSVYRREKRRGTYRRLARTETRPYRRQPVKWRLWGQLPGNGSAVGKPTHLPRFRVLPSQTLSSQAKFSINNLIADLLNTALTVALCSLGGTRPEKW